MIVFTYFIKHGVFETLNNYAGDERRAGVGSVPCGPNDRQDGRREPDLPRANP